MKHFYVLLFATIAFLMGNANAQTQNLYVEDLEKDAQGIVISPGYLTMLEFYQEVDQVWGGQQGLLKIDASNSNTKLILTSTAKSGETDLIVEVGDHTLLFHITMSPGKKSRRYVVLLEKPVSAVAAAPVAPVVNAAPAPVTKPAAPASKPPVTTTKPPATSKPPVTTTKPAAPKPEVQAAPAPVLEVPAPVAVVPAPSPAVVESTPAAKPAATSTLKQVTTKPAGVPSEFANPKWLSFRIIGQPVVNAKGETLVPYSLRNNGNKSVTVDFESITIMQGNNEVECRVDGESGPISLKPGTALTGRLRFTLDSSMATSFNLTWSFLEEISNDPQTFVISRGVSMK
jgi:hypothetical protein